SALLQFFQVQAVHNFFGDADKIPQKEWLGDEIFDTIHQRTKAFFDIGAASHEEKWDVASLFAAAKLFKKLAAVESGHLVITKNGVRRVIDDFQQRVGTVGGEDDVAMRFEPLVNEVADEGIVVGDKQSNRFCGMGG